MYRVTIVWNPGGKPQIIDLSTEAEAFAATTSAMSRGAYKASFEKL